MKRREDANLEQQFVLRLPISAATSLRQDLEQGSMSLKDKLSFEIHPETRRGKVFYDGQLYHAKLMDLPCIVESYKTTDRKSFYKSADISQILICKDTFEGDSPDEDSTNNNNVDVNSNLKRKDKEKKFLWNHGLCPPLKNVRKRRFRKTLQKKNPDQPDLEKELKSLFRMDFQAIDVKYEVIYEDDDDKSNNKSSKSKTSTSKSNKNNTSGTKNNKNSITPSTSNVNASVKNNKSNNNNNNNGTNNSNSVNINNNNKTNASQKISTVDSNKNQTFAEHEIFGEISSSDNEDEDNTNTNLSLADSRFKSANESGDLSNLNITLNTDYDIS